MTETGLGRRREDGLRGGHRPGSSGGQMKRRGLEVPEVTSHQIWAAPSKGCDPRWGVGALDGGTRLSAQLFLKTQPLT